MLIVLLFAALVIFPAMLSSCGRTVGYYEDDGEGGGGIHVSYKKSRKSARSLGGSRSYRGGK